MNTPIQEHLGIENEAGTDLRQSELSTSLLLDLVVTEVDAALKNEETEDVVNEGLGASVIAGNVEGCSQEGTSDAEVSNLIELSVEVKKGARILQAVTNHAELISGVNIQQLELHRGAVGRLCHPQVRSVILSSFEEDGSVAVVELAELTEVAADILTDVEFGVGATVGHDAAEILEEVAILGVDGAGADDEDFLEVGHSFV